MPEYTPEELAVIDKHFEDNYSSLTTDQIKATIPRALAENKDEAWYKSIIKANCVKMIQLHRAAIQFPSLAADGVTPVKYFHVRALHEEKDQILKETKTLIREGSETFSSAARYQFEERMRTCLDENLEPGLEANREWWDSVKYERCPPKVLAEKMESKHDEALSMNKQFDKQRQITQALDTLTPENRILIEGLMRK